MPERPRRPYGLKSKSREKQADDTRRRVISAGRKLFSEKSFHSVSVTEIVKEAGLTQGALYHHFSDKTELFWAVSLELFTEVLSWMKLDPVLVKNTDAWTQFRRNIGRFLAETVMRGEFQNIIVNDGPVVLGWKRWQEIQETFSVRPTIATLEHAMEEGVIPRRPSRPLALLILASLNEAALTISHTMGDKKSQHDVAQAMDDILLGLSLVS